ncbi:MAG: DDE-type integrase/transposase/recombinase [Polyangiaceae bacterium]
MDSPYRRCTARSWIEACTSPRCARCIASWPRQEKRERDAIRGHRKSHEKPSLTATAPNQVWTWDITKLAMVQLGNFLHLYVIIDLFSRYVVGWMVANKECKHLAAQLFAETITRHGVEPGLQVHADRGAAMKSDTLAQLLASLGVQRSFSRPHVSDDNAFSEAQFKTLKYQPDCPRRFENELHAAPGWRYVSSAGTTTSITTLGSRSSRRRTSSLDASSRCELSDKPHWMRCTRSTRNGSCEERRACYPRAGQHQSGCLARR